MSDDDVKGPSDSADPDATTPTADAEPADTVDTAADQLPAAESVTHRHVDWPRVLAYGVLPALALILALSAGGLKYLDRSVTEANRAGTDAATAAAKSTVAILSYTPDKVEQQLKDARRLLTGEFQDSYTGLTNDVVIPGAKQKQITAVATVPAASVVSAQPNHAVVLLFVNQTVVVGSGTPSSTASSVNVTLDEVDGKWLISAFDPV